jgi:hypothetical protein
MSPDVETNAQRLEQLEEDFTRLHLLVQSISRMLVAKGVCTEDELVDLAMVIDAQDGVVDGRVTPMEKRPVKES